MVSIKFTFRICLDNYLYFFNCLGISTWLFIQLVSIYIWVDLKGVNVHLNYRLKLFQNFPVLNQSLPETNKKIHIKSCKLQRPIHPKLYWYIYLIKAYYRSDLVRMGWLMSVDNSIEWMTSTPAHEFDSHFKANFCAVRKFWENEKQFFLHINLLPWWWWLWWKVIPRIPRKHSLYTNEHIRLWMPAYLMRPPTLIWSLGTR